MGKNLPANAGDADSVPGLGRSLGEGNGYPSVFLPGKSHGHRSLVGYSLWSCKRVRHALATIQDTEKEHTKQLFSNRTPVREKDLSKK